MNNTLFALLLLWLTIASESVFSDPNSSQWNEEQLAIIELNRWLPLSLDKEGFNAFSEYFHPEYTNWYMKGDKQSLVDRDEYLSRVKAWHDQGNYATKSEVIPISIEVFGDIAYIRFIQVEHFANKEKELTMFIGQFASLLKKHNGRWKMYRTSFQERYRGPLKNSE